MKFELGAYSFGAAGKNPDGDTVSSAQAVRNLLEQIRLAEQAGLDFFGVGEHHTASMPVSSPSAVINAAAAVTSTITLSTAVSVLSTDSFPLFGYDLDDYDRLYADKLGLLLAVNDSPQVSWDSPFRPPLKDALVVPRPDQPIPIWLGTGGNPGSTIRAGQAGLPVSCGSLSGTPQRWGQQAAYATFGRFPPRSWADAAPNYSPGGMVFAGDPAEIAERIVDLHRRLGHTATSCRWTSAACRTPRC